MIAVAEKDGHEGVAEGFAEIPNVVYANDPSWVPEEPMSLARAFHAKNPWFAAREARTWCVPGKARVAAFYDPALEVDGDACAFFGFWESTGDVEVARALMDRARAWAKARGAGRLFGPIQFSTAHSYRIRTSAEARDAAPLLGEPYNPPSYAAELESLGFAMRERYATSIMTPEHVEGLGTKHQEAIDDLDAKGYRVEALSVEAWTSRLEELHSVVEEAFKSNFAYTPIRYEEFLALGGASYIRKFDPASSLLVYSPQDRIVGFALNALDFSSIVAAGAGDRRVPASAIDHKAHAPLLRAPLDVVIKTICVLPEHRNAGLMHLYMAHVAKYAKSIGARRVYGALMREGNPAFRMTTPTGAPRRWFSLYVQTI
jgi:GNAT superfamily N-acetyltransferase